METINLYGAGGHAKVIMDIIRAEGNKVGCLYDDNPHCTEVQGVPVCVPSDDDTEEPVIISIGSNKVRRLIANRYKVRYAKAIHPSAIISPYAKIGEGTVVMQGAIIQTETSIGNHCIINSGASVGHECRIGDYVHISPHATLCGNVHVGEGSWIGAGTTVIPGVKIGKWCTIGAGSVVVKDVPDGVLVLGNRAKIVKANYGYNPSSDDEVGE